MTVPEYYDYLVRARRDLWAFLQTVPDDVLSKPVLPGERFHCLKDLIVHVPIVEDSWLHEDILRDQPVWEVTPCMANASDGPVYAAFSLEDLLGYWQAVERSTLAYLERLTQEELERKVTIKRKNGEDHYTVHGLLWHVMQHETRHTAQIALLTRQAGCSPPQLDLLVYLPSD
jgi:uncharacterized damage-inducible protein DinB